MKAKIDLDKFVRSLVERYYEKIHIDPTTTKCWLDTVLEDQGLEYKDGEIVEIKQEQPYNKPLFFEKGKWYTCIAKVDGFKVGHTYQSKMEGTVSNDSGAMYMYHNDVNFIFRPATEVEVEKGGELRKWLNFGNTHEGTTITIPKDLKGTDPDGGVVGEKGEEGEEPQEQDGFEAELNALLKKYEHLSKHELADSLEFYLNVVKEQHKTPFNKKRLMEVAKPETLEEKVGHWQRMHDIAMEKIKGKFKEEDSLETKATKEQIENLKKRIEDNQLGCIVQRLDKIIELLQSAILILPEETRMPHITYKRPLDPDPNVPGGWTTTASTFGSDYDSDKINI